MIPSAGWAAQVTLPIEDALMPIRHMKNVAYSTALALMLLSLGGIWVFLRQALMPLHQFTDSIRQMTEDKGDLRNLPISGDKEIRELASKSGNWELHLGSL